MKRSTFPAGLASTLVLLLSAGCGGDAASSRPTVADDPTGLSAAAPAPETKTAPGADHALTPSADRYSLERFAITTETYSAPVKVGLRTRRESSTTLTRYVENHGGRVAMETRSGDLHEQYFWDGRRGIVRDVTTGTTTDQGGVRLNKSRPEPRAVAPAATLESWGFRRGGEKTVLGRPCEVWSSEDGRSQFCRWQQLVLQSLEFDADGTETGRMAAIRIDEGEGIPAQFESLADRL